MGQRHNRRRTRPRSSHQPKDTTVFNHTGSPILAPSSIWCPTIPFASPAASYSTTCVQRGSPVLPIPAPTWHYGYSAWQIRETKPILETGGIEEQYRLFGGEPGDDVNLCYRMLEYFGGLDYIDSVRQRTLGD